MPELTPLDRRVLEAVQDRPRRPLSLAEDLQRGSWRVSYEDVTGILRGLEHLGLVKKMAGGWWRAT